MQCHDEEIVLCNFPPFFDRQNIKMAPPVQLLFGSTRGFGPFGHAARLVLVPKHRLTDAKSRDAFAGNLSQQRAGKFKWRFNGWNLNILL